MVTRRTEPVDFLNLVTRELLVLDDAQIDGNLTVTGTITGTISFGFTEGSVFFANSSGNAAQDNANLFWNDTTNRLGIGTATPDTPLHIEVDDAVNAGITQLARLTHTTSGAPGVGIGVGLEFEVETSAGNNEIGAIIEAVTTNVGAGTEAFDIVFRTMLAGAAAAEVARITSAGNLQFSQSSTISATGDLTLRASAGNDVLIGDDTTLIFVDGGLNAIGLGSAAVADTSMLIAMATRVITADADGEAIDIIPLLTESAGAGTHALMVGLNIQPLTVTSGTGVTTLATTVRIVGPATGGATNLSLLVDDGNVEMHGLLALGSTTVSSVRGINANWRFTEPAAGIFGEIISAQVDTTSNNANVVIGSVPQVEIRNENTADWTAAVGFRALSILPVTSSGSPAGAITGAAALFIRNSSLQGTLTLATQYGIFIENLTAGANDYGIFIAGAGTLAIWVDAGDVRFDNGLVVNEDAAASGDFRVESENNTEMLFVDANLDAVAIGRTAIAGTRFIVGGNVVSSGGTQARALYMAATLLPGTTGEGIALRIQPTGTANAGAGTHPLFAGLKIDNGVITAGTADVTDTAMLYIDAAMTASVTGANYSIWVDAGPTRLDGPLTIDGAFTIQANSATEIGFAVVSTALTIGTLGSMVVPVKTDTGAPNDAAFGNLDGAFGFNSFDNTLEVRDGADTFLSVGVAGIVIQRRAPVLGSMDGWYHPQQYLDASLEYADETRCIHCGEEMQPGDRIGLYANGRIRNDDLHAIYGHDHIELSPYIQRLEGRIKELEAALVPGR